MTPGRYGKGHNQRNPCPGIPSTGDGGTALPSTITINLTIGFECPICHDKASRWESSPDGHRFRHRDDRDNPHPDPGE